MRRGLAVAVLVAAVLFALDAFGVHLHRSAIEDDHRLLAAVAAVVFAAAGLWGLRKR